ncbi:NADH-ubiquinone oxidoreductase-F iron-sulfur binding region domain-containing protein [Lapillicoccus jejuensis]|uniref:NADH:ubiquinone oxidoreductase subunit F (NADH-binding) n=1 Tax=Lapillicoccus jejuensis TaxID=402171 RepID=A0A542DVR9_9MICO|nr:NADH-ubiquinone oxidoreductase-F iron-sulfur binding region domain-containing protein [Lapillicoccus jejuensis]TQJ07135.1 NADH:ubiquinone oxidoreductase subunit F (NADH-binding) [Lapillicoccus jejuensis]
MTATAGLARATGRHDRAALADLLEAAGLTGRGGASFSTATKLRSALDSGADMVVNCCDGELGAGKDAWLVAERLDEVRRGAALVTGGRPARWAAHRDSRTAARLHAAGLDVLEVPHRYVSSEESSLVALAHGGLARPVTKHQPVSFGGRDSEGRRLRPTLVLNAETLWLVAGVAERGAAWFRSVGTVAEPGPRLVAVGGDVASPGVLETSAGIGVRDLVEAAGGPTGRVVGINVGGLSGGWLSAEEARGAVWSRQGLAPYGIGPGPGVVHVLADGGCPVRHVAATVRWAAGESAGQCGPCMFGLPAVADDLDDLAAGWLDAAGLRRLRGRLGLLPGRGACRFPDGVAGYAASALRVFATEVDAHRQGSCRYGAPATGARS